MKFEVTKGRVTYFIRKSASSFPFYEILFLEGIQPKIYFSNYHSGISVIATFEWEDVAAIGANMGTGRMYFATA